jgi:hypothetical protein
MRDANMPVVLGSERMENMQQNHRVNAAGNGNENSLPAQQQPAILDFAFDAME